MINFLLKSRSLIAPTFLFYICCFISYSVCASDTSQLLVATTNKVQKHLATRSIHHSKPRRIRTLNRRTISRTLQNQLAAIITDITDIHGHLRAGQKKISRQTLVKVLSHLDQIQVSEELSLTYHQKMYLNRQFSTITENIRFLIAGQSSNNQQLSSLKKIYQELIHITQIYSLDKELQQYSVYFCSRDENVWMQRSHTKVYNPFGSNYRNGGKKIR